MGSLARALVMWVCVGFSSPAQVTNYINTLPKASKPQVVVVDGQYQVFYRTDDPPQFLKCCDTCDCVPFPGQPEECK